MQASSIAVPRSMVDFSQSSESRETTSFGLRRPFLREHVFWIQDGAFTLHVFDQPGVWCSDHYLDQLYHDLFHVAGNSMDEIPHYGPFTGRREAFNRRIVGVVYDDEHRPVGFTAMVYLPYQKPNGKEDFLIHLGLTMIDKEFRGRRLQTALLKRLFLVAALNQWRTRFVVTNIAASPAGIGATSDYFNNVYPHYAGYTLRQSFHSDVARQVLGQFRNEFGCSRAAVFEPVSFVVRGSNNPSGGGAHQFIKHDPVSRYRIDECNAFCQDRLNFAAGDELFQVGEARLLRGLWASRNARRGLKKTGRDAA